MDSSVVRGVRAAIAIAVALSGSAMWTMTLPEAVAGDWPQLLGPNRSGVSEETVASTWPASGPVVRWSRAVGAGFSGPSVMRNRVLLHHRQGDEDVLECMDAATGTTVWRAPRTTTYRDSFGFDEGPRAVPTVAGDAVYTFGAEGTLSSHALSDGRPRWSVPTARELGADQGFFGFACSPLVIGNVVVVQVGGKGGAGIVGFETATGKVRWKAMDHEAGYASPVQTTLNGRARAVCFTREGLVVLDPESGVVDATHPWRSRQQASVNAATPLISGDRVFLTTSYDTGAILLALGGTAPRKVWSGDESISSHYASVVASGGLVFGFHGRQEQGASLRCIELETGRVRWTKDGLGSGALIRAADQLIVLTERGELMVAPAKGDAFQPTARAQVLGSGLRAQPALAAGCLYARDPRKLVCLALREGPATGGKANP